ncbi:hypothetical protein EV715DRAFT_298230 [Schizophyllum commune]
MAPMADDDDGGAGVRPAVPMVRVTCGARKISAASAASPCSLPPPSPSVLSAALALLSFSLLAAPATLLALTFFFALTLSLFLSLSHAPESPALPVQPPSTRIRHPAGLLRVPQSSR